MLRKEKVERKKERKKTVKKKARSFFKKWKENESKW